MQSPFSYEKIKKIINLADPIGLVDFDTPESLDEYKLEIEEILKLKKDISFNSVAELGSFIYEIFKKNFNENLAGDKKQYLVIAEKILETETKYVK